MQSRRPNRYPRQPSPYEAPIPQHGSLVQGPASQHFGISNTPVPLYTGHSSSIRPGGMHAGDAQMLEKGNDDHVNVLSQKLGQLKDISMAIGDEVRNQNDWLKQMQDDMYNAGGLLGTTMGRLTQLMRSSNGRWMCYLMLFAVGSLTLLYMYIRIFRR